MRALSPLLAALVLALCACAPDPNAVAISWGIENKRTDDAGTMMADVSLTVTKADGKTHSVPLGRYGGCGDKAAPEDGPLLTLSCRTPGGGDDFRVRMDATNVLAIEHRALPEETFETLRTVALEDGATIVPTVPGKR